MVGVAIGAYGLTQAVLQISVRLAVLDRYGRKPVIYFGLFIFAVWQFCRRRGTPGSMA